MMFNSQDLRTTRIATATIEDAAVLAGFAERVFRETYAGKTDPDELERHISAKFGLAQRRAELLDPEMTTLFIFAGEVLSGYAQLRRGEKPDCVQPTGTMNLFRFYLDQRWHGRGVAAHLMDAVITSARTLGAEALWLGVWGENKRAIAFYGKHAFEDVGTHLFQLGSEKHLDRVMLRLLD